jgi:hypothetical protein
MGRAASHHHLNVSTIEALLTHHSVYTGPDGKIDLRVHCNECWTKGRVVAEIWEDLLNPSLELSFFDAEAYVDLSLNLSAKAWVMVDLFATQSPVGVKVNGLTAGLVFIVDLVFTVEAEVDMSGGFWVKLPDAAFFDLDLFSGELEESNL